MTPVLPVVPYSGGQVGHCHRLTHYFLSLCGLAPGVTVTVRHTLPDPA